MRCRTANINLIGLLFAACAVHGCEADLPSRAEFDAPFTMYGALTPDRDTQSVQIFVPEEFPILSEIDLHGVDVYSTDLANGARRAWQGSVLQDSLGRSKVVFWAGFRPRYGRTYRVRAIRRSDGATSFADVRIPPRPSFRLNEDRAPLLQILINGEDIRPLSPEVEYVVRPQEGSEESGTRVRFQTYDGREERAQNGWSLTVNMIVNYEEIRFILRASNFCQETVALDSLKLHLLIGDAAWDPPGGAFDPYVLSQPSRMSNVENGFGFIGGGFRVAQPLFPSREAVEEACFIYSLQDAL